MNWQKASGYNIHDDPKRLAHWTNGQGNHPSAQSHWATSSVYLSPNEKHPPRVRAMQNVIEQFRRYPTTDNARRLRQYFERNPSRVWVVRGNDLHMLAAADFRGFGH